MQWVKQKTSGFTIVELLIVIVVIAILAAITIVAYNGIQDRANDTVVMNDIAQVAKKMQLYNTNNGQYASDWRNQRTSDSLYSYSFSRGSYAQSPAVLKNIFYCTTANNTQFALGSVSKSGKRFYATNDSSVKEYTGSQSWAVNDANSICASMIASSTVAGWTAYDSNANPDWRW